MKHAGTLLLIAIILCASCQNKPAEKPKVTYGNSTSKKPQQAKVDTAQVIVADLPILMPGSSYLIHPIGELNISGGSAKSRYESSAAMNDLSYRISNYSENEITGYLHNIKFQQIGSDSLHALTDKQVLIQTVTLLKSEKYKPQIMVYTLADEDTNKDGRLDASDIKTLYLSTVSGERFTKISPEYQELIDWNMVEITGRLYFRTIEDANKNGEFDKDDLVHYHYADLFSKDWKVSDYSPI